MKSLSQKVRNPKIIGAKTKVSLLIAIVVTEVCLNTRLGQLCLREKIGVKVEVGVMRNDFFIQTDSDADAELNF